MDTLESLVVVNPIAGYFIILPCCHVVATPLLITLFFCLGIIRWQTPLLVTLCFCLRVMRCQTPLLVTQFFCLGVTWLQTPFLNIKFPRVILIRSNKSWKNFQHRIVLNYYYLPYIWVCRRYFQLSVEKACLT